MEEDDQLKIEGGCRGCGGCGGGSPMMYERGEARTKAVGG